MSFSIHVNFSTGIDIDVVISDVCLQLFQHNDFGFTFFPFIFILYLKSNLNQTVNQYDCSLLYTNVFVTEFFDVFESIYIFFFL